MASVATSVYLLFSTSTKAQILTLTRLAGMLIDTDKCYWNVLYKGKVSIEDGAQVLSLLALLVQQYKY